MASVINSSERIKGGIKEESSVIGVGVYLREGEASKEFLAPQHSQLDQRKRGYLISRRA